ncbi:MAG: DUF3488 and transglutaminase-like domain-containing protein [Dermatophilaceae bacterium]
MKPRAGDTVLAATASLLASLGLGTLVQQQAWVPQAVWLVGLVALTGGALRRGRAGGLVVVVAQVVVVALATTWSHAASSTWYGLPTWSTVGELATLVQQFGTTAASSAAPIPSSTAVELTFALMATAIAIAVDHIAVTRQAPAAAGLPLLVVFLATAANNGAPVSPVYFLAAATAWLVMLAHHGLGRMRGWSARVADAVTPVSDRDEARVAGIGFGSTARRLGLVALVLALVLPAVLPHLPTRYLLDGLGRGTDGSGALRVGFSSTLDVSRSLTAGDSGLVLTYRTTAPSPPPLRVAATSTYDGRSWARPNPVLGRAGRLDLGGQVARVERTITVEENRLDPPSLATAQPVVAADFKGAGWLVDETTSDLYVQSRASSYTTTYLEAQLTAALLRDGVDGVPGPDQLPNSRTMNQALVSDRRSESRVRNALIEAATAAGLVDQAGASSASGQPVAGRLASANPYDVAMAIQQWLRDGGGFVYSLSLPAAPSGGPPRDPVSLFLETRTGYCVQFASAMILMARAAGIPARMAIGFLPGTLSDGVYTVVASDAHAWPELYFPGAGWVRFEPTPASRTGSPPAWTVPATTSPESTPETATTPEATQDSIPTENKPQVEGPEDGVLTEIDQPWWDKVTSWLADPGHVVLLALALGLVGALVLPLTAALVRRRRDTGPPPQRIEAQWASLTSRLADLGLRAPTDATLRDAEKYYRSAGHLDEPTGATLAQVVATVERVRYARPGSAPGADLAPAVRRVAHAVARGRSARQRTAAFLRPGEGARWWRERWGQTQGRVWRLTRRFEAITHRIRPTRRGDHRGR